MKPESIIREYRSTDFEAVLGLLRLNTPQYFSADEEKDFVHYLNNEVEYYFIIEIEACVVGCGGFNFSGDKTIGKIAWDILHPNFQGQSLGSKLLMHRIGELKKFKDLEKIIVRTSQLAYRFYEKNGFKLLETVDDYWAKGFHLYKMAYTGELAITSSL